jgi:uncharacterized protein (TIGR03435 family)
MVSPMSVLRVVSFILLACCAAFAEEAAPAFEVATIKPSTEKSLPIGIRRTEGQFTTSNTSVAFLIRWAYNLDERRLIGTTAKLESLHYDIVAKMPAGELHSGQLERMMQALLAERFQLRVHKEMKDLSTYTLAVDKDAPKLSFVELGDGFGQSPFKKTGIGRLVGTKVTAEMLAKVLSNEIGRPIEDTTGIKQPFDFVLEWAPDVDEAHPLPPMVAKRASLFTAIREQLGLRLVSHKSTVEVVKIDSVSEIPTEN